MATYFGKTRLIFLVSNSNLSAAFAFTYPLIAVNRLKGAPRALMSMLMPDGDGFRSLCLQLRLDQEQRAAEERTRGTGKRTSHKTPDEHGLSPFVGQESVALQPLVHPQPDAVPHRVHGYRRRQALLQPPDALVLEDHDAGVQHVPVVDRVLALRPQLALQLHPGLEDVEGIAEDAGARRRQPTNHEIHAQCWAMVVEYGRQFMSRCWWSCRGRQPN